MNNALDLSVESLDDIETPLTDMEWGMIAGAAFGIGVLIGIT